MRTISKGETKNRWQAHRLEQLPPYLFVEIDRKKREALAAGRDVIDFGVGDPDMPTPDLIVEEMAKAVHDPKNHRYPQGAGSRDFRLAVVEFFRRRFGVALDPDREVLALIGSKEGLGHFPLAVVNPGETVLIPDPGYPVYTGGAIFAGATCHYMTLREDGDWLPNLRAIPAAARAEARLMFLNYPNNPTAACASLEFFERAIEFAREHHILIAQDAAYSEVYFDAASRPPSILQVAGAKDIAVEFHSFSKTFNMTGWRVGFAVGNADALAALAKVKNNIDSGVFTAIQAATIRAMQDTEGVHLASQLDVYRRRRDILVAGLRAADWQVQSPDATFYVWTRCPRDFDSMKVASRLLDEADIVAIPGVGFGAGGEGYVRFALTVPESRTAQAVTRLMKLQW